MEFVLTGDSASGAEFERLGVVNKVFPRAEVVPAALKLAERIAVMSGPVVKTAKQAVLTGGFPHSLSLFSVWGMASGFHLGIEGAGPCNYDSLTPSQLKIATWTPG